MLCCQQLSTNSHIHTHTVLNPLVSKTSPSLAQTQIWKLLLKGSTCKLVSWEAFREDGERPYYKPALQDFTRKLPHTEPSSVKLSTVLTVYQGVCVCVCVWRCERERLGNGFQLVIVLVHPHQVFVVWI